MVLLPCCWHRQHFDSPFTTTWFKVSSFILVPAIPEVLRDCAGRFLPYFARISSTSSRKNFNKGILFRLILQNILQEITTVALSKWKKATTTFSNGFAHDKLTRTGQINQHFPYLHYTHWKDLVYVFSQLDGNDGNFVVSPGNKQIVSIQCVIKWFPCFLLKSRFFL